MIRQNPVPNSQQTSQEGDAELARWLTRDLRVKGAPLSSPPGAASTSAPSEAEVLAGWLVQDLTPKHSVRPRASLAPSEPPPPAPLAAAPSAPPLPVSPFRDARGSEPPPPPEPPPVLAQASNVDVAGPVALAPVDSLAPQEVMLDAPSLPAGSPAALDDDDLAVLPGRRRAAGSGRKKRALLLLGVSCLVLAVGVGFRQRSGSDAVTAASSASPTGVSAVLPPPPPSEDELLAPEQPPEPPVRHHTAASSAEPDDALDPLDPRNSLGGPSVRRYADVPSPTLSRLAREQRRLQRERDEAVRKAKMKKIPR
jgi:hypothetical protein